MKLSLPSLLSGLALATSLAFAPFGAQAQNWTTERWVGTWGAGPGGPPLAANTPTFTDQTVRFAGADVKRDAAKSRSATEALPYVRELKD